MPYKVVFLGDSGIGKTTLCNTHITKTFYPNIESTMGVACFFIKINVQTPGGLKKVDMDIWDTAGQEKYRSITSLYYRTANAVGLIFDLTNINSFASIKNYWINMFDKDENGNYYIKSDYNPRPIYIILVGTKSDLQNKAIKRKDIENFCSQYQIDYMETSSCKNINVDETFLKIATNIHTINCVNDISPNKYKAGINLNTPATKGYCCYYM